ncbi:MAG: HlyC/CorC family transporter [Chromatiaceae bacterium]|nr:HlyC/CorC family transporter [Chromatiaceae bacterium]MCP5447677.1 HlyC/CorC family transporter [Chromatiaceae bacterium]
MDLAFWLELILFIILMLLSGFFSSSETAMFSLNSVQLEQMRQEGNSKLEMIERMLSEPRRLIVTILIGNEFVNVAASVISAAMVIQLAGAENKFFNLFIMVPILLIFGEITPKTLAIRNNIAFASAEAGPISLFARLITPIRWAVRTVSDWITTFIVGKERSPGNIITEDMVRTLAHEAVGEGVLHSTEAQFIDQIFELGSKSLEDILTPRAEINFISSDVSLPDLLLVINETRQSRFPVYENHRDNILGILHARDLLDVNLEQLKEDRERFIKLLRKPYFVPESKPALELLDNFRQTKRSFTLTVDEYGGVTGLVTMEDLLECIFGDIPSPSDQVEQFALKTVGENQYLVDGVMPLEEFNAHIGSHFSEGEAETIGGLVLRSFGELPHEGASIELDGIKFTAQTIAYNRIDQLLVTPPPPPDIDETPSSDDLQEPTEAEEGGKI